MDVINSAKKISEAGADLDKLCKQIADQVSIYFMFFRSQIILFQNHNIINYNIHALWNWKDEDIK